MPVSMPMPGAMITVMSRDPIIAKQYQMRTIPVILAIDADWIRSLTFLRLLKGGPPFVEYSDSVVVFCDISLASHEDSLFI